jgi:protein-histidine N-methyltransferase
MTEADPSASSSASNPAARLTAELAAGLSTDDIVNGVYEGGFKTWECAVDLARFILDVVRERSSQEAQRRWLSMENRDVHFIEVRCILRRHRRQ